MHGAVVERRTSRHAQRSVERTHSTEPSSDAEPRQKRRIRGVHEDGRARKRRTSRQIFKAVLAELPLRSRTPVVWSLETRTGAASSVVGGSRTVHAGRSSDPDNRSLHAEGRAASNGQFSMVVEFISFFEFVLSVLLAFHVVVLDVVAVDHHLETTSADLHRLSENDAFTDSPEHIEL